MTPPHALPSHTLAHSLHFPSNQPHLAYKLEAPLAPGPAQALFKVEAEGDMIISIKVGEAGRIHAYPYTHRIIHR